MTADATDAVPWLIAIDGATNTPDRPWLLWDVERGAWWKANGFGYTLDITEARLFTRDDAIAKSRNFQQPDSELIPVPAPTGRVVIPVGLDTRQLVAVAHAIDVQARQGPIVRELAIVRDNLADTVEGAGRPAGTGKGA